MFEHFTTPAREAVVRAQEEAIRLRHNYLGKEHLIFALASEERGIAGEILREFGVHSHDVEREIVRIVGWGPPPSFGPQEAEALETIGIDLSQVRKRTEAAFGPGVLDMRLTGCGFRFTPKAKEALELASKDAKALGHPDIGTEHLLLGLARSAGGAGADVLRGLGLDPQLVRARVLEKLAEAS